MLFASGEGAQIVHAALHVSLKSQGLQYSRSGQNALHGLQRVATTKPFDAKLMELSACNSECTAHMSMCTLAST
jgi:hypothetical protein